MDENEIPRLPGLRRKSSPPVLTIEEKQALKERLKEVDKQIESTKNLIRMGDEEKKKSSEVRIL